MNKLRLQIVDSFNQDELRTLCFDLQIPYEELNGTTHTNKVIALIEYCQRRDLFKLLIQQCQKERPHISWEIWLQNNFFSSVQYSVTNRLMKEISELKNAAEKSATEHDLQKLNRILGQVVALAQDSGEPSFHILQTEVTKLRDNLRNKLGMASTLAVTGNTREAYRILQDLMNRNVPVMIDSAGLYGVANAEVNLVQVFITVRNNYLVSLINLCQQRRELADGIKRRSPRAALQALEEAYKLVNDEILSQEDKEELYQTIKSLENEIWELKSVLGKTD